MKPEKKTSSYSIDADTEQMLKEIREHLDKKFYKQNGIKSGLSISAVIKLTSKYYYDRIRTGAIE